MTPLVHYCAGHGNYHINLAQHVVGSPSMTPLQTVAAYASHFVRNVVSGGAGFAFLIAMTLNVTLVLFPRGLILIVPWVMLFIATGSVQSHRHAILIAPLFITLAEGVARMPSRFRRVYAAAGVLVPVVAALLLSRDSLIGANVRELLSPGYRNVFHYRYTRHDRIADSLLQTVPPRAPAAADAHLRTKLVDREWAFIHPSPGDSTRADWYLFDFFEKREYESARPARARVASLLRSGGFILASNLDGLVILKRAPPPDGDKIPLLLCIGPANAAPPENYGVEGVSVGTLGKGYALSMRFHKGATDTSLVHAFISFFIDAKSGDTLRVLHLATYTACRLEALPAGSYEEAFYFDATPGAAVGNRRHEVWLFEKPGYLPFFARDAYRVRCLWKEFGKG
jgi:hypothetical protein